ncbi:sigma-54-dependent transcriptional regulator [Ramlibacter tataouinensis]|uniref:Candidate response regulator, NtrC n=1 Tax=Ramlibacter tataouinensis (strain ATCC BAA-407 / DSM 14655 / LMG 21543 / TTB310) TaxID=365046 RepID=F5Y085_RAMTT|nr:sigma-54 dependent transcriptional regulator [Ramlibacter tataouinensis]AEG92107.1 candidate response regulator, NtrC [Ramlibacter tataouinensis TTB310]
MGHALIVEDDADSARMMAALVASEGYSAATAPSLRDARRQMAMQPPDLVLLDLQLPDGNGMALLDEQELIGNSEVVLMTGHASLETSIQALRYGAADYLVKPVSARQLQGILSRVMKPSVLQAEVRTLNDDLQRTGRFGHLVGTSAPMRLVYEQIARVAGTSVTVFVTGESGTGKELVARTVHDLSRRRARPFLAVNCGAISPHLIESEIFGHEKGSFTGAERQHQGFFERAHGGTLFLDEITEMPLELQVKLLRVLETGTFMRVGSTVPQETDVRVVAAANRDLGHAVATGALREDLMYRLNVFPIELPPLRDRKEDLPLLVRHFLQQIGEREGQQKQASEAALERLARYRWPGNVRELRNVLQRAWVMTAGAQITDQWLPRDVPTAAPAALAPLPAATAAGTGGRPSGILEVAVGTPLATVERQVILATLEHFGHHKERTAAALGVSLKTLYNRLKEYGV